MQILQLMTTVPKNGYSTEELMQTFPCPLPESVVQNVLNLGVSKRYLIDGVGSRPLIESVLSEHELVDLCTEACDKATNKAGLSVDDVGYFVVAYDVNPFLSPGLSQLLVPNLGFSSYVNHVNVQGIASTAFPKALQLAENYLAAHPNDFALICVSGVSSYWFQNQVHGIKKVMEIGQINKIKKKTKRLLELRKWIATMQFFLFGDGVAAAVVANGTKGLGVEKIVEVTNLRKEDYMAGYARLTGIGEPFKFGFHSYLGKEIPRLGAEYTGLALKKLLGTNDESVIRAVKKWVVHTGSEKILKTIAEEHGIEHDKLIESLRILREYGNLAGASLPFILGKIVSGKKLSGGDLVLMVGYGWGFSAAACLLKAI